MRLGLRRAAAASSRGLRLFSTSATSKPLRKPKVYTGKNKLSARPPPSSSSSSSLSTPQHNFFDAKRFLPTLPLSRRLQLFYDDLIPNSKVNIRLYNLRLLWVHDVEEFFFVVDEEMRLHQFEPNVETWQTLMFKFGREAMQQRETHTWTLAMHEAAYRVDMMEGRIHDAQRHQSWCAGLKLALEQVSMKKIKAEEADRADTSIDHQAAEGAGAEEGEQAWMTESIRSPFYSKMRTNWLLALYQHDPTRALDFFNSLVRNQVIHAHQITVRLKHACQTSDEMEQLFDEMLPEKKWREGRNSEKGVFRNDALIGSDDQSWESMFNVYVEQLLLEGEYEKVRKLKKWTTFEIFQKKKKKKNGDDDDDGTMSGSGTSGSGAGTTSGTGPTSGSPSMVVVDEKELQSMLWSKKRTKLLVQCLESGNYNTMNQLYERMKQNHVVSHDQDNIFIQAKLKYSFGTGFDFIPSSPIHSIDVGWTVETYKVLIADALIAGDRQEAQRIVEEMNQYGVDQHNSHIVRLMSMNETDVAKMTTRRLSDWIKLKNTKRTEVMKVWNKMMENHVSQWIHVRNFSLLWTILNLVLIDL